MEVSRMSAYVVERAHIAALVDAARDASYGGGERVAFYSFDRSGGAQRHEMGPDELGQMLTDECVRSVSYRYPDSEDLPGTFTVDGSPDWIEPYRHRMRCGLPAVAVLKAIAGYEYQTCEHPEWRDSLAFAYCRWLQDNTIPRLPGYDAAQWEVTA